MEIKLKEVQEIPANFANDLYSWFLNRYESLKDNSNPIDFLNGYLGSDVFRMGIREVSLACKSNLSSIHMELDWKESDELEEGLIFKMVE